MKYVLLFGGTKEGQAQWESMPEDVRNQAYARIGEWFQVNGSVMRGGYELQGPDTATTVRFNGSAEPIVTDGPFIEGNEVIGGYAEIEVGDLDEALRLAKTWPGGGPVEVRPVVDR
jgi:hypothetical protein